MRKTIKRFRFLIAAVVVAAVVAVLFFPALVWSAESSEVLWADPFVVRRGETVSLTVSGRSLPREATVAALKDGSRDGGITVVEWKWHSGRAGLLTLKIDEKAEPGLRGIEFRRSDGSKLVQSVAFRVADNIRLPWPHESLKLNKDQQEELRHNVFVINNFGAYQASNLRSESYFHDGLDIVLPQGTPIYSLADGIVRDIFLPDNPGQRSIAIEDRKNPGFGWNYVHTDRFLRSIGDVVRRGEQIAEVAAFDGLDHIHLNRVTVPEGRFWGRLQSYQNLFADDFFELRDEEAPTFHPRLFLFRNNSNELMHSTGGRPVASGDVDIVIAIRDGGHYAHSKDPSFPQAFGDRLIPAVIRCDVLNSRGELVAQWTRDMTRMYLGWAQRQRSIWDPERVAAVFQSHLDIPKMEFNSYFILTNSNGINLKGEVDPANIEHSWQTAAKNERGERIFPNGIYTIRITAWDSSGNRSSRSQRIQVRN